MRVQLVTNDSSKVLKEIDVKGFPNSPQVIFCKSTQTAFIQGFVYGTGPTPYVEQDTLVIE